jgi:Cu-Zn family superoxide dismutase
VADADFVDSVIALQGEASIVGRGMIVHAGRDDLTSQPSGAAGPRVACGVIGIASGSE